MYWITSTSLSLLVFLMFSKELTTANHQKELYKPWNKSLYLEELRKATELLESSSYLNPYRPKTEVPRSFIQTCEPLKRNAIKINRVAKAGKLAKIPNSRLKCRMFCKSGYFLQILPDGTVRGTTNKNNLFTHLELQSYGKGLLRIKGIYSMNYLSLTKPGKIIASKAPRLRNSIFKETNVENAYKSYSSYKYFINNPFDLMFGLAENGKLKKPRRTSRSQTETRFLIIKAQI